MNKIRLITFLIGLMLVLTGIVRIILVAFQKDASVYSPAILVSIGGILIIAVRRK